MMTSLGQRESRSLSEPGAYGSLARLRERARVRVIRERKHPHLNPLPEGEEVFGQDYEQRSISAPWQEKEKVRATEETRDSKPRTLRLRYRAA